MSINKKLAGILALTMAGTIVVSGCGETKDNSNSGNENKAENVKIELFNQKGEIVDILGSLVDEFNKNNPGVTIEVNSVPDATQVFASRLASNDVPELFTHWPNATFNEQVEAGYVMDLTGDDVFSNVRPEVVEECTYNGKNYILPISYNTVGIYYNKAIFADNGLEIPKTQDELYAVADKLKANGIVPFSLLNKDLGAILQYTMSYFYSMDSYDQFLADSLTGKLDLEAYGDQLKEVGNSILKINEYGQEDSLAAANEQAIADFANGKSAMVVTGSWSIPTITSANPDLDFEMFTFPGVTEDKTVAGVFTGDFGLAISANAKYPEQDKAFLKYMSETETATKYAEQDGSLSCIQGVDIVSPMLEKQYEVIAQGKIKLYPDASWNGTVNNQVGQTIQELIISKDVEAWIEALAYVFESEYAN